MRDLIEEHNSLVLLLVSKENKSATWVGWGGGGGSSPIPAGGDNCPSSYIAKGPDIHLEKRKISQNRGNIRACA